MCIKHEHKEHQIITELVIIGDEDKEATNSKTEVLVVKPKAEDQSKSEETKQSQELMLSFGDILEHTPVALTPNSPHQT